MASIPSSGVAPDDVISNAANPQEVETNDDKGRSVTPSSGNVFADLGLPNAEEHLFKAQIVAIIDASIRKQKLTGAAAARRMGLAQPDISRLLRGRFEGFSLDRLFTMLQALGHDLKLEVTSVASENQAPGKRRLFCI